MSDGYANIESLVRYLVESLVDSPEAVRVSSSLEDGALRISVAADPADVGKIIGRSGRTIKSIRTLARAAASSSSFSVDVDVEG